MEATEIKRVAVIGAGLMGFGVAAEFARFGCEVGMFNTRKETGQKAMTLAKEAFELMVETGLITASEANDAYRRLHPSTDLAEAAAGADFINESVAENLALKQEVFAKLDAICPPPTILATNTSSLSVTDIAAGVKNPERVVATHYFQPPHFVPLVEVVPGNKTDKSAVERAAAFMRRLRKRVVVLPFDSPGFIGNRIQGAIAAEIQRLVDRGLATPETIDDTIQYGFGRRMAYTGYFKRMDLIGLDFVCNMARARGAEPWKPIAEHVERGELGMDTGKGFYDWSGDAAARLHRLQNTELIRLMKKDREAGNI